VAGGATDQRLNAVTLRAAAQRQNRFTDQRRWAQQLSDTEASCPADVEDSFRNVYRSPNLATM
jgi:hypothetical protein